MFISGGTPDIYNNPRFCSFIKVNVRRELKNNYPFYRNDNICKHSTLLASLMGGSHYVDQYGTLFLLLTHLVHKHMTMDIIIMTVDYVMSSHIFVCIIIGRTDCAL